ncbi:hypothetical protein [Haladaptatus caseinilyticus]|uniref:hypothetical protein n=1 Tax=Haladaptatus caseinilyticus TaxID=2993314 RepID=UPI00224AD1F6|nr:hypothetical protein [Haladaptatus caseinilyticus]
MNFDSNRSRGVLTPADRAYLLGEAEMSHEQSKRNAEARIRRRVTNSVLDFDVLVHHFKQKDRQQVFAQAAENDDFIDGLRAMLSFVYIGMKEQGIDFETVLKPAIQKSEEVYAADRLATTVDVDVAFDVETTVGPTVDDITTRLDAGDAVTPRELFSVIIDEQGVVDGFDEIQLRLTGNDSDVSESEFVDRIARFLDVSVEQQSESLVVLRPVEDTTTTD